MRIQVGIHENAIIEKVTINDKCRLLVNLKQKGETEAKVDDDLFAQMNASEVIEKESGGNLIFWPFKATEAKNKEGVELSDQQRGESANGDVMQLKNQFQQILEQYTTKDNIK